MSIKKTIGIGIESGYRIKQELGELYDSYMHRKDSDPAYAEINSMTYKFYLLRHGKGVDKPHIEKHLHYVVSMAQTRDEFIDNELKLFSTYFDNGKVSSWSDISTKKSTFAEYDDPDVSKYYNTVDPKKVQLFKEINWKK